MIILGTLSYRSKHFFQFSTVHIRHVFSCVFMCWHVFSWVQWNNFVRTLYQMHNHIPLKNGKNRLHCKNEQCCSGFPFFKENRRLICSVFVELWPNYAIVFEHKFKHYREQFEYCFHPLQRYTSLLLGDSIQGA